MVGHIPRPRSGDGHPKHLPFSLAAVSILRNPAISESARLLYAIMTTYADTADRDGFAGRRRLANDMGKSMNTITRLLKELEKHGALTRSARFEETASGKKRRTTDEWTLLDANETSRAPRRGGDVDDQLDALRMANTGRLTDGREPLAPSVGDYL
jgi:hypothetical protein